MNRHSASIDINLLKNWHQQGVPLEQFTEKMQKLGADAHEINSLIEAYIKMRYETKQRFGLACCGAGEGILLVSFLITFILFDTEHSFAFYLYGLTFIGITILFKGLIDLLGW